MLLGWRHRDDVGLDALDALVGEREDVTEGELEDDSARLSAGSGPDRSTTSPSSTMRCTSSVGDPTKFWFSISPSKASLPTRCLKPGRSHTTQARICRWSPRRNPTKYRSTTLLCADTCLRPASRRSGHSSRPSDTLGQLVLRCRGTRRPSGSRASSLKASDAGAVSGTGVLGTPRPAFLPCDDVQDGAGSSNCARGQCSEPDRATVPR